MEPIVIGKHCQVSYMPTVPCVHIKWFGMPPTEEFRLGCDTALVLMKKHNLSKILTDISEAKFFSMQDQKWLNENWLPRAEKVGYKCSATLVGFDAFAKFAATNIANKRDKSKFTSKFFQTTEDALDWLKSI